MWFRVLYGAVGVGLIFRCAPFLYLTMYSSEAKLDADEKFLRLTVKNMSRVVRGTELEGEAQDIISSLHSKLKS